MLAYLLARLSEPSTWRGIVALLTAAGVHLCPEQLEAIVTAGLALIGLIGAFTADRTAGSPGVAVNSSRRESMPPRPLVLLAVLSYGFLFSVPAQAQVLPWRQNSVRQRTDHEARLKALEARALQQLAPQQQQPPIIIQSPAPQPIIIPSPAPAPQPIVLGSPWPQQYYQQISPQQQLPIQGTPQQQLPIQGTPQQQLPIQGTPQQQLPIQGSPQQQLPAPGAPQQQLPPAPRGTPGPQQQLPLGPAAPTPTPPPATPTPAPAAPAPTPQGAPQQNLPAGPVPYVRVRYAIWPPR